MAEIARLCNWTPKEIQGLKDQVWDETIRIDNRLFEVFHQTNDQFAALIVWEAEMEELRRWLSLTTGIKIRYI